MPASQGTLARVLDRQHRNIPVKEVLAMSKLALESKTPLPRIQIGDKFGRLIVLEDKGTQGKNYQHMWLCQCACGNRVTVRQDILRSNQSRSCGCLQRETIKKQGYRNTTHGHTRIKTDGAPRVPSEYQIWQGMLNRCRNPKLRSYKNYGGRGITVCDRWNNSFEAFIEDVGRRPSPAHTLERINNNGHYEPSNVRWATRKEQCRNTRRNRLLTLNGETRCVSEWAELAGLEAGTLEARLKRGCPLEHLLLPLRRH